MFIYKDIKVENNLLSGIIDIEDKEYYNNLDITYLNVYVYSLDPDSMVYTERVEPFHAAIAPSKAKRFGILVPNIKEKLIVLEPEFSGIPTDDTPCGKDIPNKYIYYYKDSILAKGIDYLRELSDNCSVPKNFINFILSTTALDMAADFIDINKALKLWRSILGHRVSNVVSNCGCK